MVPPPGTGVIVAVGTSRVRRRKAVGGAIDTAALGSRLTLGAAAALTTATAAAEVAATEPTLAVTARAVGTALAVAGAIVVVVVSTAPMSAGILRKEAGDRGDGAAKEEAERTPPGGLVAQPVHDHREAIE